ncbi:MAG: YggS family pyridoxal phosphate-dependent enzyme [Streptosporangiaceae bacterium]
MTGPESPGAAGSRRAQLAANLIAVRARIEAACHSAGRDVSGITMIAITKTHPASDVRLLAELGVTNVGENRDQEAAPKAAEVTRLGVTSLTWHFVGQLQTNKAASVARYAGVVHSVDRDRLVHALATQARRAGRTITCLIQVSLDEDPARGGALPGQVPALADAVAAEDGLVLGGVMAVAPLGEPPPAAAFARLAAIAADLRAAHPAATMVSAGMSADLEEAISAGATHLRVGTALLGARSTFVG